MGRELGGELAPGFMFALEKGARRGHRLGRGAAVFFDVDDVEQVAGLARHLVLPHSLSGAKDFDVHRAGFALEKGACRSHPLVDDIEQGPVPARCLERPRPPFGAGELDVHRVFGLAVDKAHAPSAVYLDALWQKAPAERLGVGRERGVELALGFMFAFETGFNLALEKGAPRGHRLGRGAAVFSDEDDVEQVAWLAG